MTPSKMKALAAAGFTLEQIIIIGEADEADISAEAKQAREDAAERREKERQRKLKYREKTRTMSHLSHDVPRDTTGQASKPNEINGHVPPQLADVPIVRKEEVRKQERDYSDFGFIDDPSPPIARETPDKVKAKSRKVATRLASDWVVPQEWIDIATKIGLTEEQARHEAESIRDWSLSAPGGAKLDWLAAWRNWVRRRAGDGPRASAIHRQYGAEISNLEKIRAARAKRREEEARVRNAN